MAKIPSSKLSDKTNKKTGVVMVISVGGKPPKKPTKTADTEKAEQYRYGREEPKYNALDLGVHRDTKTPSRSGVFSTPWAFFIG